MKHRESTRAKQSRQRDIASKVLANSGHEVSQLLRVLVRTVRCHAGVTPPSCMRKSPCRSPSATTKSTDRQRPRGCHSQHTLSQVATATHRSVSDFLTRGALAHACFRLYHGNTLQTRTSASNIQIHLRIPSTLSTEPEPWRTAPTVGLQQTTKKTPPTVSLRTLSFFASHAQQPYLSVSPRSRFNFVVSTLQERWNSAIRHHSVSFPCKCVRSGNGATFCGRAPGLSPMRAHVIMVAAVTEKTDQTNQKLHESCPKHVLNPETSPGTCASRADLCLCRMANHAHSNLANGLVQNRQHPSADRTSTPKEILPSTRAVDWLASNARVCVCSMNRPQTTPHLSLSDVPERDLPDGKEVVRQVVK